jgi:ribosomal protein S27AE
MYGPRRRVERVGPHEADGTRLYLECGHALIIASHFDAQREAGSDEACGRCQREAEEADPTLPRAGESIATWRARQ